MKTIKATVLAIVMALTVGTTMHAQESESPFSIGADLVSNYVWRGVAYGGPSVQPGISFTAGALEIGAWGSWDLIGGSTGSEIFNGAPAECDLYLSYGFDFGLGLGVTDYYYQTAPYFNYSDTTGAHAFEINASYAIENLSISANYILNQSGLSEGGDMYFELGYAFEHFDAFIGGGNGWHTGVDDNGDDVFGICNVGIGTSKDIKITDSFSLPMFGQVIWNPEAEGFNLVVGISL